MAIEKKVAVKKAATTKKATTTKAPKAAAPKVEEAKVETKKAAPAKKVSKGNKKPAVSSRLKEKYDGTVVPALIKEFGYTSVMQAPRLEKIVINIGVGEATQNEKLLEDAVSELATITGQAPVITKAKKSVASFKLREGQAIGCKVTLRGLRMYDFFDKLVSISLPRVRDFRGVSKTAFDGHGNYTLGVKEQLIFPEIDYDKVSKIRGMDIVIVTTAHTDREAEALLRELGMPFRR